MNFAKETPLDAVLKHVKASTRSPELPKGLAIYVDPIGLKEAEQSLNARVSIDLDGIPLRRTLTLVLGQLGLRYHVQEDMILISSAFSEVHDLLDPNSAGISPIARIRELVKRGEMNPEQRKAFIKMLEDLHLIDDLVNPRDHHASIPTALQAK